MLENLPAPADTSIANQWIEYGSQLRRFGKRTNALQAFDRAITLRPDLLNAYYGKGLVSIESKNYFAALEAFNRAIILVPIEKRSDYYYLWRYQSSSLRGLRKYSEALLAIDEAIKLVPQDINLLNEKALVLEEMKKYSDAVRIYDEIIVTRKQEKFWAYFNRGNNKSNLMDRAGAMSDYDKAITPIPA
jgi:tetratricopeptide (TPR) repeat protein